MVRITTEPDIQDISLNSLISSTLKYRDEKDQFKRSAKVCIEYSDLPLTATADNKKVARALETVREIFQTNPKKYSKILLNQFRPTIIKVGTVGSFLFGCFQNFYGDMHKICSPLCIGNLSISSDDDCEYQVWIQDPIGEYKAITTNSNNHAYVYTNEEPLLFSTHAITKFREAGIKYVQVFSTKDSKHQIRTKIRPISQLPLHDSLPIQTTLTRRLPKTSNMSFVIIGIVIILIFIVFLIQM